MDYFLTGEESKRLYFRKVQPSNFELWLPFHEDPSTSEFWPEENLSPKAACQKWFDNTFYTFEHKLAQSLISIIHIESKASQHVAIKNGMSLDKTTTYKNNPVHIFRVISQ